MHGISVFEHCRKIPCHVHLFLHGFFKMGFTMHASFLIQKHIFGKHSKKGIFIRTYIRNHLQIVGEFFIFISIIDPDDRWTLKH